jgi:hypothetical protein
VQQHRRHPQIRQHRAIVLGSQGFLRVQAELDLLLVHSHEQPKLFLLMAAPAATLRAALRAVYLAPLGSDVSNTKSRFTTRCWWDCGSLVFTLFRALRQNPASLTLDGAKTRADPFQREAKR